MASTLKAERNAVRARLNDLNFGNAILQSDLVDAAIQDVYGMMVNEGLSSSGWGNTTVTLSEGINEYLGGTAEYARIQAIRFSSGSANGQFLTRVDPVTIKAILGDGLTTGLPQFYALVPSGGTTLLIVAPNPDASQNNVQLDLLVDAGMAALVLDTDELGLSRTGLSALRELAAAKIAKKAGSKLLEKLDLPPDAWQDMKQNGDRLLYSERLRVSRQLRVTAVQQWMA